MRRLRVASWTGGEQENPVSYYGYRFSENKDEPLCLINPVITGCYDGDTFTDEGCMWYSVSVQK